MSLDFPAQTNPAQRSALQLSSLRGGADASYWPYTWLSFADDSDD